MCSPFSCIIHKSRGVLVSSKLNEHSHSVIAIESGLKDESIAFERDWLKVELTPGYGQTIESSPDNWTYCVDEQGTLPQWYTSQANKFEKWVVIAAKAWQKKGLLLVEQSKSKDPKLAAKLKLLRTKLAVARKASRAQERKANKVYRKAKRAASIADKAQAAKARVLYAKASKMHKAAYLLENEAYRTKQSRTNRDRAVAAVYSANRATMKASNKARQTYYKVSNLFAHTRSLASPMDLRKVLTGQ